MKRAGVIGLGLIGGSIALSLRENGYFVVGVETDPRSAEFALARGIADEIGGYDALTGCEVVFVCVPLPLVRECVERAAAVTNGEAIITDVGSVKSVLAGVKGRVIGGHPMAGTENSGIRAARSHLFENAYYVLVWSEGAKNGDMEYMKGLVRSMGAQPLEMTAAEHDERVSKVSHLPHAVAYALCNFALEKEGFTGTGFMDSTRIAASDPGLWTEIMSLNRDNLLRDFDAFTAELNRIRAAVESGNKEELYGVLRSAGDKRRKLRYSRGFSGEYTLDLDIKDEPGAILRILATLADAGINVAGVRVMEAREESGGALRVFIGSESDYEEAKRLLLRGEK